VREYGILEPGLIISQLNKEVLETKADKQSIGRSAFKTDAEFTNHRKKFKYKNLKETILKIQKESMSQQRAILDETIEKWRGDLDQLDDILVIGRRF